MGRLVKDKELWLGTQLSHELRLHMEDLAANQLARPGSAGIAFSILALVALSPYELTSGYLPALLLSVVLSLVALFSLASRIFTPSHFNLRAGVESAAVGGFAAGFLYVLGLIISSV